LVAETHSSEGKACAVRQRLAQHGLKAFWSHGGNHRAGIGIIIRLSFLEKFQLADPKWFESVEGEAGVLRVRGSQGNLDLFSFYKPTGNQTGRGPSLQSLRSQIHTRLAAFVQRPDKCLTIMGGDFNYVSAHHDRWTKATADWSGRRDDGDEQDWQ